MRDRLTAAPAALAALFAIGFLAVAAAPVAAADFPAKDSALPHVLPRWRTTSTRSWPPTRQSSRKFSIGTSYQGRDIWALKISDHVATDENEPEVMFDGAPSCPRAPLGRDEHSSSSRWLDDRLRHG